MNIEKEREAFESTRVGEFKNVVFVMNEYWPEGHYVGKSNHNEDTDDAHYLSHSWFSWVDRAKLETKKLEGCVVVPERTGGFYIQDLRNPIGNCMKFWYKSGYGTKHKNFSWCATYEEAQEYAGGCDWFKIWYAPYIDTLIEHTVDMQHADRVREKAMVEAARGGK